VAVGVERVIPPAVSGGDDDDGAGGPGAFDGLAEGVLRIGFEDPPAEGEVDDTDAKSVPLPSLSSTRRLMSLASGAIP
jgi:hypothetical protein